MSKAEGLAKEYAEKFITVDHQGDVEEAYIDGYHQAEEDLKLTWQDIALIETISKDFIKNNTTPMTDRDYYQEILKRFDKERQK